MQLSFCSQIFESNLHIPRYLDWFQNRASYLPALRFHKQLLQLRKVYEHFNEPFTPEAQSSMARLLNHSPQGKHGKHEYSLAEFGLTATGVRQHFHDYCARFEIPLDRRT